MFNGIIKSNFDKKNKFALFIVLKLEFLFQFHNSKVQNHAF